MRVCGVNLVVSHSDTKQSNHTVYIISISLQLTMQPVPLLLLVSLQLITCSLVYAHTSLIMHLILD